VEAVLVPQFAAKCVDRAKRGIILSPHRNRHERTQKDIALGVAPAYRGQAARDFNQAWAGLGAVTGHSYQSFRDMQADMASDASLIARFGLALAKRLYEILRTAHVA
jgi:hypothetical protein